MACCQTRAVVIQFSYVLTWIGGSLVRQQIQYRNAGAQLIYFVLCAEWVERQYERLRFCGERSDIRAWMCRRLLAPVRLLRAFLAGQTKTIALASISRAVQGQEVLLEAFSVKQPITPGSLRSAIGPLHHATELVLALHDPQRSAESQSCRFVFRRQGKLGITGTPAEST